ncbi:hypothetical protein SPRG_19170 [Saprolegnia parasitica CBS 223.65]|uniref:HSF-type DNA-binding domain-containing protein n=1 Tax=Saprolegnia parasitica (strain CBS 223.65) TaxID=695850 RepID=A0A067D3D3_SAPPC|nr:hypothetical protein SPRG_19170 [Saprolegnia parasitica CBS 223.65]KDO33537.1 hypothetical protein SPRG_19170 [Saprolegnia parasitica CBS 223.65]|eukprot:XP_012195597.1 hypothetical protein SPRG_19170 [Saprolegnia parasitica CBS 223.65]
MLSPLSPSCLELSIAPFLHSTFALFCQAPPTIAHWTHEGTAVVIHDLHRFAHEMLPRYFGHCNLVLFVRQLHGFGFRNFKSASGAWEFCHTHFVLEQPERLRYIQRADEDGPTSLQVEMSEIGDQVSHLTALVSHLTQERRCCLATQASTEDADLLDEVFEILELPQQPLTVVPSGSWDY